MNIKRQPLCFHGEKFYCKPLWQKKLASIGIEANGNWQELTGDDVASASINTVRNYRFALNTSEAVYFKRYTHKGIATKYFFRPGKAIVEVFGLSYFSRLGIPVPDILAWGEKRWFGFLKTSFIVTQAIPDTVQFDLYLIHVFHKLPADEKHRVLPILTQQLLTQLRLAHHAGLFHHDLKLRNILISYPDNEYRLTWIDCPRARLSSANNIKAVVFDLHAIALTSVHILSRTQHLRLLIEYAGGNIHRARTLFRMTAARLEKHPPRPFSQLLQTRDITSEYDTDETRP